MLRTTSSSFLFFIFIFSQPCCFHAYIYSNYKSCHLTAASNGSSSPGSTLHMCLNHPPSVLKPAASPIQCAKLCEESNIRRHYDPRNTSSSPRNDLFFSITSLFDVFSYTLSSPLTANVTLNYFNFESAFPLPMPIFVMTSSSFCFAFDFDPASEECGLFLDDGVVPTISTSTDPGLCHLFQRRKEGASCYFHYRDCEDYPAGGADGVQWIVVDNITLPVYCSYVAGNKYTVIQRRVDESVNFHVDWQHYEQGFGDLNKNFWLGNYLLHRLTSSNDYTLRLEFEAFNGMKAYQEYFNFSVGGASLDYPLSWAATNGSAGNAFPVTGTMFTTKDRDRDLHIFNCATLFSGGWWFDKCHKGNPNGDYLGSGATPYAKGINWFPFRGSNESLKSTAMMLKRQ